MLLPTEKGIPEFWLTAIRNTDLLADMIKVHMYTDIFYLVHVHVCTFLCMHMHTAFAGVLNDIQHKCFE